MPLGLEPSRISDKSERMGFVTKTIVVGLLLLGGISAYARLAPSDPVRWHVLPQGLQPGDGIGSAVRMVPDDGTTLARLDQIIRATPRTTVLAGSVDEGMITYITRSLVFGFPDYTTVAQQDGQIVLYGRLRVGKGDMGVNAKRLDRWLSQL